MHSIVSKHLNRKVRPRFNRMNGPYRERRYDTEHYNRVIHAIAKRREHASVSVALELLHEARSLGVINPWTYANMFDVIAKSEYPNVRLAMRLFHLARREGNVDAMVYNNAIQVIARAETPDLYRAIYLLRDAKLYGIDDAMVYCSTLDALARSAHVDKITIGLDILSELRSKQLMTFPTFYRHQIDLHGLSFGAAYFLLKHLLERRVKAVPEGVAVSVIYGKGLHSQSIRDGVHPLKRAVLMVVEEMGDDIMFCEDEMNAGNGYFFPREDSYIYFPEKPAFNWVKKHRPVEYGACNRLGLFKPRNLVDACGNRGGVPQI